MQQARLLKLKIEEARKMSIEEIDGYCSVIKGYENSYYEDIRLTFI